MTMELKRVAILLLLALISAYSASAKVIYVDDDGPADFNNIQAAIDDANDGDTVIVADGTYTGDGNRDIDFKGKAITVRSENGPQACIIDCQGSRGFYFHSGQDENSILDGFTITNADGFYGGAITCDGGSPRIMNNTITGNHAHWGGGGGMSNYNSSPIVTNCTFSGNSAKYYGGGMFNEDSRPTVTNCIFSANSAEKYAGGGMYNVRSSPTVNGCTFTANSAIGDFGSGAGMGNFDSSPTVKCCTFTDNSAQYSGGGMCNDNSSPRVTKCTFTANSAKYRGGGMFNYDNSSPTVTNCTIAYNSSANGPAVACDSSEHRYPSSITMVNSVVWNGHNWLCNNDRSTIIVTYSNIQGGYSGRWWSGNMNADPCFADATDGDYHLKSEAGRWDPNTQSWVLDDVTSLCIDAGDPASPIGLEPFPNGGIINMGAYGGTDEASKSYFGDPICETIVAGDINGDCKVDLADFAIMSLHWLAGHNP